MDTMIVRYWLLRLLVCTGLVAYTFARDPLSNGPEFTSSTRTWSAFKTEPTIVAEDFHVERIPKDRSVLAPGYIMMNSMNLSPDFGYGLSIYTEDGELVWRGPQDKRTQNFQVCDFLGEQGVHLCYYTRWGSHRAPNLPEGKRLGSRVTTYGHLVILDQNYKKVSTIKHGFDKLSVNGHAFETWDNGYHATTIVARPRAIDLTDHGGPKDAWITNHCIQDYILPSGEDYFHWCYYESGLSVWNSKHITSKHGGVADSGDMTDPWDFMHANAIAKNVEGDYIMSLRHLDALVKVAGKDNANGAEPGKVLWILGGKANQFKLVGFNSPQGFTRQHDVKILSTNGTKEVLTLFNNAWDYYNAPSQLWSEGQIIELDTEEMVATLINVYPHPRKSQGRGKSLADGRGSVQKLPNGNVMVGWGDLPDYTEFAEDGSVLYHVRYLRRVRTEGHQFSYRIYRQPWVGKPLWDPKLVAYSHRSRHCQGKKCLRAYVSWNGATEVKDWRFIGGKSKDGPWEPLGAFPKKGFETSITLEKYRNSIPYILAEALDAGGEVLGSVMCEVFPPKKRFRSEKSRVKTCYQPVVSPLITSLSGSYMVDIWAGLVLFLIMVEYMVWFKHTLFLWSALSVKEPLSQFEIPLTESASSLPEKNQEKSFDPSSEKLLQADSAG